MNNIISLEEHRTKGAKIFTGRDRGEAVRNESKIDEIEAANEEVEIVIPDNLYSINPSFFEELFVNVVSKLGRKEFFRKFKFTNQGDYNYYKPLEEAVNRILREKTALD
jgi:restriction endonuclease Mrr